MLMVVLWCTLLQQYWAGNGDYQYITPAQMRDFFSKHVLGQALKAELTIPLEKTVKGDILPCICKISSPF